MDVERAKQRRARSAWRAMVRRCTEPRQKNWKQYGGAGIVVHQLWQMSFQQFLGDLGLPPTPQHWLGRINTAESYLPGNVEWVLLPTQNRRRQCCRKIPLHGEAMTATEAARRVGVNTCTTVTRRLAAGLPLASPAKRLYRASVWIEFKGETLRLPEWARRQGLTASLVWVRIRRGWAVGRALTLQPRPRVRAMP